MSADTTERSTSEKWTEPQPVLLLGAAVGLLLAAALCLVIAWLRLRNGWYEDEVVGALWRTTIVVGIAGVIGAAYLGVGRLYRRSSNRLSRFLAATSGVPAVVGLSGLVALHRGTSAELFSALAYAQQKSGGPIVTAPAREAWWLACLAVMAVALVAVVAHLPSVPAGPSFRWPSHRIASTVVAVATASILVVPVTLAEKPPPAPPQPAAYVAATAEPLEPAPVPSTIVGDVVYRVDGIPYDAEVTAAGPGFVTVIDDDEDEDATPARLVGYDGATGQERWSYQLAEATVASWEVSGTGTDSIVVLAMSDAVLGIDATTGELLWSREHDVATKVYVQASSDVVLVEQDGPSSMLRTVLELRSGDELWSDATSDACASLWRLSDDVVLVPVCDAAHPDVAAKLMEPETGGQRGEVRLSSMGVDALELRRTFGDVRPKQIRGSTAVFEIERVQPDLVRTDVVIDLRTGRLLATVPPKHSSNLLDSRWMALFGPGDTARGWPGSILDLQSGAVLPIGLYTRGTGDWYPHPQVIPVGREWITALFTAAEAEKRPGQLSMSALRVLDSDGVLRVLPSPCAPNQSPALAALAPGAVLARCGDQVVGIR